MILNMQNMIKGSSDNHSTKACHIFFKTSPFWANNDNLIFFWKLKFNLPSKIFTKAPASRGQDLVFRIWCMEDLVQLWRLPKFMWALYNTLSAKNLLCHFTLNFMHNNVVFVEFNLNRCLHHSSKAANLHFYQCPSNIAPVW